MRALILILFLGTTLLVFSQQRIGAYNFSFSFRGKVLGGPNGPENMYGRAFTIGAEVRFLGKHSFGIDWVDYKKYYEDETLSSAGYYENAGLFDYTQRKYALVDYRFYFVNVGSAYNKLPYLNVLWKCGKQSEWFYDEANPTEPIPWLHYAEFNEFGLGIGHKYGSDWFGIDVSVGLLFSNHFVKYDQAPNGQYDYNYHDLTIKPNMRLNLYVEPFHIRKH